MKHTSDYLNEIARNSDFFYELTPEESDKLKSVLLDIYKDIKRVCDKYGIMVMLSGGSCLGAVRHKGYIPWDDDLDLMMSRDDYEKLKDIFDEELSDKYSLSVPRRSKESIALSMRIIKKGTLCLGVNDFNPEAENGICIDVFPIEKLPDNSFCRRLKCWFLDILRICVISSSIYLTKNQLLKKSFVSNKLYYYIRCVIGFFFSLWGRKRLYDYFDRIASNSKGKKYSTITTGRGMSRKECLPTEVFFPSKQTTFEGVDAYIPNDADRYLSNLYGDYMKIPPVEKRERHFYVKLDFGE